MSAGHRDIKGACWCGSFGRLAGLRDALLPAACAVSYPASPLVPLVQREQMRKSPLLPPPGDTRDPKGLPPQEGFPSSGASGGAVPQPWGERPALLLVLVSREGKGLGSSCWLQRPRREEGSRAPCHELDKGRHSAGPWEEQRVPGPALPLSGPATSASSVQESV